MESVSDTNEIQNLENNRIMGDPNLINSVINFAGKGNVLYCEPNVTLARCTINFKGNNSLIYLSSNKVNYSLNVRLTHNSLIYFGRDNALSPWIHINAQEHKNVIIGDDCTISSNVSIRTTDVYSFYSTKTKKRVNFSKSVFIGDHVFLGQNADIEKGAKIGSGSIIENNSHINSNLSLASNTMYGGSPLKILQKDIFFIKDYPAGNDENGTKDSMEYASNIYIYSNTPGESLDLDKIDAMLCNFNVNEKIDFIHKLFVQNKKHNRFSL